MVTATYKPDRKRALLLSLNIDNLSTTAAGQPVTFKIDVEEDTPGKAAKTVVSGWVVSRESLHIQGVYEFQAQKDYLIKWSFTGKEGRNQYKITVNRFTAGALQVNRRAVSTTLRQPDSAFTVATPCWRRA